MLSGKQTTPWQTTSPRPFQGVVAVRGRRTSGGGVEVTLFLTAVITGVSIGAVYGMIAVGYTVVYNATRVFNLAQGDLLMVGVMLSYLCLDVLKWPQAVAFVAVVVGVTVLSVFEERVIVRPFLKKSGGGLWGAGIGWFIATLAFSLIV